MLSEVEIPERNPTSKQIAMETGSLYLFGIDIFGFGSDNVSYF